MQIAHVGIIMADDNELLFVVPIAEGLAECQQIVCASMDMEMDLVTGYASYALVRVCLDKTVDCLGWDRYFCLS